LIDFFGEILKIVKLNCDPVLRQVTGIAQTISELRRFLPGPPEERAFLVGETIVAYDLRYRSLDLESGRVSGYAEGRVPSSKRCSFRSHTLFSSDEFDPSELL
jgi:hypothetical protein